MWYLVFLPVAMPEFRTKKKSLFVAALLWVAAQAYWLFNAYQLEMVGLSTYGQLFAGSIAFFFSNIWIVLLLLQSASDAQRERLLNTKRQTSDYDKNVDRFSKVDKNIGQFSKDDDNSWTGNPERPTVRSRRATSRNVL